MVVIRPVFNLGITELFVIGIILILVVGPDRLPTFMKTVGKTMRGVRQASRDLRQSVGLDEMMRDDYMRPAPPRIAPRPPSERPVARDDAPVEVASNEPGPAAADAEVGDNTDDSKGAAE